MIIKIIISVLFAFIIVLSTLFYLHNVYPDPNVISAEHPFFFQEFDPNIKKIFIIGSSHVGQINNTHIIENISKKYNYYSVYNLAIAGDSPNRREKLNQPIISLKPEIIFYGINYRDFLYPYDKNILPDFKQITDEKIQIANIELKQINPKSITLRAVLNIFSPSGIFDKKNEISIQNTPFFKLENEHLIISDNEDIQRLTETHKTSIIRISSSSYRVDSFEKIISDFKKNGIKTVIFITPVHQNYLELIPEKEKDTFYSILESISQKYDVKIYDFSQNYVNEQVWENLTHLAYNKKSSVYYDDLSEMIILEIEK